MIKIGIIEDSNEIVQSLTDYFQNDSEILLIGSAMYVEEFIRKTGEDPDILILDLELPFKNGMDSIPELLEHYPSVSIIIHSVLADYDSIFKCLCSGAHSYLTKGETLSKIRETVISTYNGGSQMSVQIARKVIDYFAKKDISKNASESTTLNSREKEVVQHILDGKSYKMVAAEMQLSINTIRTYIKSIYRKLNINSSMELANLYMKK